MNTEKIHNVVFKQIIYLMYTSRSFGISPRADMVSRVRRNAITIKISNIIAYTIATLVSSFVILVTKNAPISLIFLDLIIFANIITTGLNVVFFATNSDLKTFLLTLPLTEREINIAIIRGIFEFFLYGFLVSVILTPIVVYATTLSPFQAFMSELEVLFFFFISFSLMLILGKRIRLGIASTLFRIGTSLIWLLFVILPYGLVFKDYSLPIYLLPIFPFDFFNIFGIILSVVYVILSLFLAYNQTIRFLSFRAITKQSLKYTIRLESPIIIYLYKDIRGLLRVPQASFLLTIPVFALIFSFFAPLYSIFYTIFMITTSSITLILLEASGMQLLLTLPSGLRSSYLSKFTLITLIYLIDLLIFSFFGHGFTALILLPATLASVELSLFISYNNVLKGKGIRIADPISLIIREIEINSIVGIASVLLYLNVYSSLIFSIISLILITFLSFKKIK
jgi:predicted permease